MLAFADTAGTDSYVVIIYNMSSPKVEDLRAYEVRTVNRTHDGASGMRKKVARLKGRDDFRCYGMQ